MLYELMSLDGFADEPGEREWLRDTGSKLRDFLVETIATQDAVLLGRRTYEKWAPYWPNSDVQPFADFINSRPKYVFTSSPGELGWSNSHAVSAPAASFVAQLEQTPGGDIGIHGSLSLARDLLAAGLVDELRLVLAPSLAGNGVRLFGSDDRLQRFDLVDAERSGGGSLARPLVPACNAHAHPSMFRRTCRLGTYPGLGSQGDSRWRNRGRMGSRSLQRAPLSIV